MYVVLSGLTELMVLFVFFERFTYVVETLEYFIVNPESTVNIDTSIKAQALMIHI